MQGKGKKCLLAGGAWGAALILATGIATALPRESECLVPAKPEGGFDLTCKLAQAMLAGTSAVRLTYLPGGIGALAYTTIVNKRADDASTLVAFSSGSLLNLAQGKFGPYTEKDVRWLAVVGTDYGVVAVQKESPFRSLQDILKAVKANPQKVVFGAGGTIGSQDWFKAVLLARAAGAGHKSIRFVAFEGGGDALSALEGGHVSVFTGDAAEVTQYLGRRSSVRVIAVLSEQRLPGVLAHVPTAREQGLDLVWPTARGFYVGPKVSEQAYREWSEALRKAMSDEGFPRRRESLGLFPLSLTGDELQQFVDSSMAEYRRLAAEFELPKR
ncbi:MAG: tripartite tricarboxylate transporter substrate-binding protein [Caldimonas sp.]